MCTLAGKIVSGRQTYWQGRCLYDIGKSYSSYNFMVSINYIYILCIRLYIIVLYQVSYKFLWNYGVYTDITPHYCTQAVESFELNHD